MSRKQANGTSAAEWFYSQSFTGADRKPQGLAIDQPTQISETWDAEERRWYRVRQWADGRVTRERI